MDDPKIRSRGTAKSISSSVNQHEDSRYTRRLVNSMSVYIASAAIGIGGIMQAAFFEQPKGGLPPAVIQHIDATVSSPYDRDGLARALSDGDSSVANYYAKRIAENDEKRHAALRNHEFAAYGNALDRYWNILDNRLELAKVCIAFILGAGGLAIANKYDPQRKKIREAEAMRDALSEKDQSK